MSWPTTTVPPAAPTSSTKPAASASTASAVSCVADESADVVGLDDRVEARRASDGAAGFMP